ncbi:hypothetical protein BDV93DRAFT_514885 [Ceratobasidium sp. AG-I]|nr:hypothetical protein BDV93DRAFT_514885 [Ceratobasidium sp. AG-I]
MSNTQEKMDIDVQIGIERMLLLEETVFYAAGQRLARVLTSFEFRLNNVVAPLDIDTLQSQNFEGWSAQGAIGTLVGKAGLFAQCGWFGGGDLDWFPVCLTDIKSLTVQKDPRFRGGVLCVWLTTDRGDYALVAPRLQYVDRWEESLIAFGPEGAAANCGLWPTCGARPRWWGSEWKADWPLGTEPSTKRRASLALEEDDQPTVVGGREQAGLSATKWIRLGPKGDHRHPGQRPTNLHHRDPWQLSADAGVMGFTQSKRYKRNGAPRQDLFWTLGIRVYILLMIFERVISTVNSMVDELTRIQEWLQNDFCKVLPAFMYQSTCERIQIIHGRPGWCTVALNRYWSLNSQLVHLV